jgi:membrane protein YdbS with pleckstrin-like domain
MYEILRSLLLPLLKVPSSAPAPPPGHTDPVSLRIFRASPNYLRYRLFFWTIYALIWGGGVLIASIALLLALGPWGAILAVLIVAISLVKVAIFYVSTRLDYEMRWYILTDRSLRIRDGVWIVREVTLTFANVQNVHVLQGPLQRVFGISDVMVQTAGGGSGGPKEQQGHDAHQALLRGLDNPQEVSHLILDLLRRYRGAGLGDRDDREAKPIAAGTRITPVTRQLLIEIRDAAQATRKSVTQLSSRGA